MLVVSVLVLCLLGCTVADEQYEAAEGATIDCSSTCECKPTVKLEWSPGVDNCHNATYEWLLHTAVGQVTELTKKLEGQQNSQARLEDEKRQLDDSLTKMKNKVNMKMDTIDSLDKKLIHATKEKNDRISKLEDTVKNAEDAVVKLVKEKREVIDTLEGRVGRRNQDIETLKEQRQLIQERVGRRDNTIQQLQSKFENEQKYSKELEQEKAKAAEEIKKLQQQLETYEEEQRQANLPRDCADVQTQGSRYSGLYTVYPAGMDEGLEVFCDLNTEGGGWTVFQRRQDGSVSFERDWQQYKDGFGKPAREFWLGNEATHKLTSQNKYELRVDLGDYKGVTYYAKYGQFTVGPEEDLYRIHVDEYTGDAGDAMRHHRGMAFSTYDNDNDMSNSGNCPMLFGGGGWWYVRCYDSNLNGLYGTKNEKKGIVWFQLHSDWEAMKHAEMKIRPINFIQ